MKPLTEIYFFVFKLITQLNFWKLFHLLGSISFTISSKKHRQRGNEFQAKKNFKSAKQQIKFFLKGGRRESYCQK